MFCIGSYSGSFLAFRYLPNVLYFETQWFLIFIHISPLRRMERGLA